MKRLYLLSVLAIALSLSTLTYAKPVKIEKDAVISDQVKGNTKLINLLVLGIRANGNTCNSISAVSPLFFGKGFTVKCNNYYYSYDVKDMGGKLVIEVD